jgi:ATP-dependent DNA helicase RecQ
MNPVLSAAKSKELLKSFFGFDDFKGNQASAVASILGGQDTFVMMPTGGGKSLCYQLPALQMDGLAIVVSPLIALMKNQVDAIRSFAAEDGIAHVWNSSLTKREMVQVRQDLASGHTKLLYMAPESLNKEENIAFLKDLPVSFYAIDEAHCISEWGHDFRPEYRQLRHAINAIQRRPILALTATATPKVMSDILKNLEMEQPATYTTSFNRANLFYSVQPKNNVEKDMIRLLREHEGKSAIVYCLSRQKVEEVAQLLQLNGISSLPYHAGLDGGTRARHQDAFLQEDVNVIVATIAFGMGIDKPDVRLVIHHDIPKSLESYYQETGRAGRDGGEGVCVTYYSEKDIEKLDKFLARKPVAEQEIGRQLLQEARGYALTATCRRHYLLHYFGEVYEASNCGACDNCQGDPSDYDATAAARLIIETILAGKDNFRTQQVVNTLIGMETAVLKTFGARDLDQWGAGKDQSDGYWTDLVRQMILQGLISKEIERYGILKVTEAGMAFLKGTEVFRARAYRVMADDSIELGAAKRGAALDPTLFATLKALNRQLAKQRGIPPYALFSEAALQEMATSYPISEDELKVIPGVGEAKAKRFGGSMTDAIARHVELHQIERPDDFTIRSAGQKGSLKVYVIQSTDRRLSLEEIAKNKNISEEELLREMELIVQSGTRIALDYIIEDHLDEDSIEEIMDYFSEESESGDISEASKDFDGAYTEEELRLVRLKFLCGVV